MGYRGLFEGVGGVEGRLSVGVGGEGGVGCVRGVGGAVFFQTVFSKLYFFKLEMEMESPLQQLEKIRWDQVS